jgi:hypothetical protein
MSFYIVWNNKRKSFVTSEVFLSINYQRATKGFRGFKNWLFRLFWLHPLVYQERGGSFSCFIFQVVSSGIYRRFGKTWCMHLQGLPDSHVILLGYSWFWKRKPYFCEIFAIKHKSTGSNRKQSHKLRCECFKSHKVMVFLGVTPKSLSDSHQYSGVLCCSIVQGQVALPWKQKHRFDKFIPHYDVRFILALKPTGGAVESLIQAVVLWVVMG